MGLFQRITSLFGAQNSVTDWPEESRANPRADVACRVNAHSALTFSGCWAATNFLAGLFGALPLKVYRSTPDGREQLPTHPTYRLLSREPNEDQDAFVFWEMMTQWWINHGNAFAEKQRHESSGRIAALWPIHPSRVRPELDNDRNWTRRWLVRNNNGADTPIDAEDMFHIVGALSDDGITGKGVLQYAAAAIGVALAESGYRSAFYSKGGRPTGVLEHPTKLPPEARKALRQEWKQIQGSGNEIAVLWEGMKFNPTSVAPEHSEIIQSSVFSIQEMARFYDLTPHVLGELSHGTFSNVEELNRFLVSHCLNRRIRRVESAIDRQLFTPAEKAQGLYSRFNVNALLRGNPKEQAEVNAILLQNSVINVDEWRSLMEMNKLPDGLGEVYWIRRECAPVELVLESAKHALEEPTPLPATPTKPATPPTPSTNGHASRLLLPGGHN